MSDVVNSLDALFPPVRELAERLIPRITPLNMYVFETYRSLERQLDRYSQGRVQQNGVWVVTNAKAVVTNAKPGAGFHTYGLALDSIPDGNLQKAGIQWSWADTYVDAQGVAQKVQWKTYGAAAKSLGFVWAGDFRTFQEFPHAELTYGCKASDLYQILISDGLESVWKYLYKKINIIPKAVTVPIQLETTPAPVTVVAAEDLDAHATAVTTTKNNSSVVYLVKQLIKSMFRIN